MNKWKQDFKNIFEIVI